MNKSAVSFRFVSFRFVLFSQGWDISEATAVAWRDGHKAMMKMTTEALGDGVLLGTCRTKQHNALWGRPILNHETRPFDLIYPR
jgi:hypothetical protein